MLKVDVMCTSQFPVMSSLEHTLFSTFLSIQLYLPSSFSGEERGEMSKEDPPGKE